VKKPHPKCSPERAATSQEGEKTSRSNQRALIWREVHKKPQLTTKTQQKTRQQQKHQKNKTHPPTKTTTPQTKKTQRPTPTAPKHKQKVSSRSPGGDEGILPKAESLWKKRKDSPREITLGVPDESQSDKEVSLIKRKGAQERRLRESLA